MIFHPCRYKKATLLGDAEYAVGLAATRAVGGSPEFVIDVMGNKEYLHDLLDVKLDDTFIDTDRYI